MSTYSIQAPSKQKELDGTRKRPLPSAPLLRWQVPTAHTSVRLLGSQLWYGNSFMPHSISSVGSGDFQYPPSLSRHGTVEFPGGSGKESTCNAGDLGSIPGLGRSPGVGNGNPLHRQRSLVGYSLWCHRVGHDWAHKNSNSNSCCGDIRLGHSPWVSLFIIFWFKDRSLLMICLFQWNISSMKLGTIHVSFPGVPTTSST